MAGIDLMKWLECARDFCPNAILIWYSDTFFRNRSSVMRLRIYASSTLGSPDWSPFECYRKRNRYMVDQSDCILAVYNPATSVRGDAAAMVKLSQKKGIPITYILPDTGQVINLE